MQTEHLILILIYIENIQPTKQNQGDVCCEAAIYKKNKKNQTYLS